MEQQLVTIIIPTFNRFSSLIRSVDSILNGTWKNLEIIVVDDCSTQIEYKELPQYYENEQRVKIIRLEKNMRELHNSKFAQGLTRNEGIKQAKGEWIGFLDDDDFFCSPNKIEIQIDAMKKINKQACCTNMLKGHGLDNDTFTELYFQKIVGNPISENISIINKETLLYNNVINNSTVLIHKSIIQKAGLQRLIIAEDYDYWKTCINYTDFIYLHIPMVGYDISHAGGSHYVYSL